MSGTAPALSLIVPTRGRLPQLERFLDSLAVTVARPALIEIILVVDEDDTPTRAFQYDKLSVHCVLGPPGRTMGALNRAGCEAAAGRYLMLLNDDVVARTPGWDDRILECFRAFPDGILLVHINDLLFEHRLCTFPIVSRVYCELAGGICPAEYLRYRIDDHIADAFNLLAVLGERRIVYLPDVIFEHFNFTSQADGTRHYSCEPTAHALDVPRFEATFGERKQLALRLKEHIDSEKRRQKQVDWRTRLDGVCSSFAIRGPWRHRIQTASTMPPVTVGLLTADSQGRRCRHCLRAVKRHSPRCEVIVLDHSHPEELHVPHELNRLLDAAHTERVVLLQDHVLPSAGWLEGLSCAVTPGVGMATPVQLSTDGKRTFIGTFFHPDESGHHGHQVGIPNGPVPVPGACSPVLMIDRTRCPHLRFDESYRHYFADLDFGLQVWEAGLRVVCTPEAVVTNLAGRQLPYGSFLDDDIFERDRGLFAGRWLAGGRFQRLARQTWSQIPELRKLLALGDEVQRLLSTIADGSLEEFQERASLLVDAIGSIPILQFALLDGAKKMAGHPQVERLEWLLGFRPPVRRASLLFRKLAESWKRARRCLRRGGYRALARAALRRLLSSSPGVPLPAPNPTRDAR